ncbi:hypothetical protein D8674_009691 [Pyrus ussuriensis x Pyrus communis]|uniref:Uncharacterized protein n=1 Tax=Pyrus ussuriensis x Pyrus communis TaxID=2448454 RepID=A0A5N5FE27_9ROSA|nr:hypothetical protein D8674_009691 [Pyrus ussuriensis x Pyrus communis]
MYLWPGNNLVRVKKSTMVKLYKECLHDEGKRMLPRMFLRIWLLLLRLIICLVLKTFEEGNVSLAEYSFALKATVGLNALVLAVALWELVTGSKIEQTLPWRPQIRFSGVCSWARSEAWN